MRPDRPILVLLVTLLLLVPAATVLAQGDGNETDEGDDRNETAGDGEDPDEENEREHEFDDAERTVEIEIEDGEARIELEKERNAAEDQVELSLRTDDQAELEVKFETEANGSEAERSLEAEFHRVVEHVDANGNGAYDAGEQIVSAWAVGDADEEAVQGRVRWQPLQVSQVTSGNDSGRRISGRASFGPDGNATFGLDLTVFGDFAQVANATLEPTQAKIDIVVEDYPFRRSDTRVAVLLETKAETEFEAEGDGVVARDRLGDRLVNLTFTWKDTATVDGRSTSVGSTVLEQETEQETETGEDGNETATEISKELAFSYARGDRIVHDPVMGVSYAKAGTQQGLPAAGVLAVLAAIGVGLWVGRRRGRR